MNIRQGASILGNFRQYIGYVEAAVDVIDFAITRFMGVNPGPVAAPVPATDLDETETAIAE